eukprot:gene20046-24036_t
MSKAGGSGWFGQLTDQLNQIKEVIANDPEQYDDDDTASLSHDDDNDIAMIRAEMLKTKEDLLESERKLSESETRIAEVSKHFSQLMAEKDKEVADMKAITENLKNSIISPTTTSNSSGATPSSAATAPVEASSLGLAMESENKFEKIYKLTHQIETLQQECEVLSEGQTDQGGVIKKNEELLQEIDRVKKILKIEVEEIDGESVAEMLTRVLKERDEKIEATPQVATPAVSESSPNIKAESDVMKEQLAKKDKELTRLREYLMEVEESHTTTDLENVEKIDTLTAQLDQLREAQKKGQTTGEQVERLQRELADKDAELRRTSVALNNLNSVLEQFQADQEAAVQSELVTVNQQLKETKAEVDRLRRETEVLAQVRTSLASAESKIQHMTAQLDVKNSEYQTLKSDIEPLKMAFDKNIMRLSDMCLHEQESVDKRVVSKLFLTYFKGNKKQEVLALIAKILGFSDDDKVAIGLAKRQWTLIPFFGGASQEQQPGEKSLTDMWIDFLLKEAGENEAAAAAAAAQQNNVPNGGVTPVNTPMSTPTKGYNTPMAPPPSPATPYAPPHHNTPASPYYSVTSANGKQKSTVIYDGDTTKFIFGPCALKIDGPHT